MKLAGVAVLAGTALLAPLLLVGLFTPRLSVRPPIAGTRLAKLPEGVVSFQNRGKGSQGILLLHGFNQHMGAWNQAWELLESCPVRQVRVDIPGFGDSRFDTDDYSIPAQLPRLEALLDELELERVTVVGYSMGGSLAAALAAKAPKRVDRVALFAPSGGELRYSGIYGVMVTPGAINRLATFVAGTGVFELLFPGSAARQALSVSGSYGEPWRATLPSIVAPTFLAWSRADGTAYSGVAREVASAIRGSTLYWLDARTSHGLRADLAAHVACELAQGRTPMEVAAAIPAGLRHPGEGTHQ